MHKRRGAGAALGFLFATPAAYAAGGGAPPVVELPTLDIVSETPVTGTGIDVNKVPAAVTIINSKQIEREHSPNIVDSLAKNTPSVDVQGVLGNDLAPDVYYRGFDASPVAGTPEGLAVYQNGIRINEAFGDQVNWDLIPTAAVRSMDVISNNPAFGLNALGGAISMTMKDGFNFQGNTLDLMGGSYGRLQSSLQWGKKVGPWATYIAVEAVHDNGYRQWQGSDVRRLYGDIGYKAENAEFHLNVGAADNLFGAAGTSPIELLNLAWKNTYTTPQTTLNQVGYINGTANVDITPTWSIQANAHVRTFYQSTQDGNPTNVQPCANPALLCYNDTVTPANGLNGQQLANPFPASATLGEIDITHTQTTSVGATLQTTDTDKLFGHNNHFVLGASYDYGVTNFGAGADLGIIQTNNYVTTSSGIFLGNSGNPVSDGPVSLHTINAYTGVYAVDAFDLTDRLTLTAGGRFNNANIILQDQLGTSLNGNDDFIRFNPMVGGTFKLTPEVSFYAGYSEANRAPTPLELGCADPVHPCILATFLVSDPPLQQVVARTTEAGFRGSHDFDSNNHFGWKLGVWRTDLSNDIENIPDPFQTGFGYFQNVGSTRREGFEAQVNYKTDKLNFTASYAYINATYLNALTLGSNSPYADANGNIYVQPGDTIPMIPHHRIKLLADYQVTPKFTIGGDVTIVSSQYYAGDNSNQFEQLPAYWVADLDASYQLTDNIQIYAKGVNIFNNHYYNYGTFFDTTNTPNFYAGGNPFTDPRSLNPAMPAAVYVGVRATF